MEKKCDNCLYICGDDEFGISVLVTYYCRRYPENVKKKPHHWCGEWQERMEYQMETVEKEV